MGRTFLEKSSTAHNRIRPYFETSLLSPLLFFQEATESTDLLSIETPEAKYFPIYESHPYPATKEELKLLPRQDVFFYERSRDSRYFINTPPQEIIDSPPTGLMGILPGSNRKYFVPRDHLEWLRENNTKICFEGYALPSGAFLVSVLESVGEITIGGIGGALLLNSDVSRAQFLRLIAVLGAVWGLSPLLSLPLLIFAGKTEVKLGALERFIIRTSGLSSHIHPEDPIAYFRNIMFARKLQFLGETISKEKGEKCNITYNVGKVQHAGIEDLLHLGKDWTLTFLNLISKSFLQEVMDVNGGLQNFCSYPLLDPNVLNPAKTFLVDQDLMNFLKTKKGLSS